jgi:hypothetical protein
MGEYEDNEELREFNERDEEGRAVALKMKIDDAKKEVVRRYLSR